MFYTLLQLPSLHNDVFDLLRVQAAGPLSRSLGGAAAWKVSAALMAKNIGGGLNFMGVASALDIDSAAVTSALAVDNALGKFSKALSLSI
jgi:uncharacterized membrane protein